MAPVNLISTSYNLPLCPSQEQKKQCINSLPAEIIINILLCFPAEILYTVTRHVCRERYNIIHDPTFTDAHLQRSPPGLLIRTPKSTSCELVQMGKSDIAITKTQPLDHCIPTATCNGLVVFSDSEVPCLQIVNLFTKEFVTIPTMASWHSGLGLGYATCSKKHKVVCRYVSNSEYRIYIFTLGFGKAWRCLARKHELRIANKPNASYFLPKDPFSVGGFVVWYGYYNHRVLPCVLSLNVETETYQISTVPLPKDYEERKKTFHAMGSSLSFAAQLNSFSWKVWLLPSFRKGEWTKLITIDLECQNNLFDGLIHMPIGIDPLGYLKNGEFLLFTLCCRLSKYYLVVCDVKTGGFHSFQANVADAYNTMAFPYVKSLAMMKHKKLDHSTIEAGNAAEEC